MLTVEFELNGQTFTALNGGPVFKFNEAISLQVYCDSQDKWTIIGKNFPKAAMTKRSNAAG